MSISRTINQPYRSNKKERTVKERGSHIKYSEAKQGRVFVIRLEHGETVHEEIEKFARTLSIRCDALVVVGGEDKGCRFVVGPEDENAGPIKPLNYVVDDVHKITGTGTLFPDEDGNPILHLHMASGRNSDTITGCIHQGVTVWQVMEVVLFELVDSTGTRVMDPELGVGLLVP